MRILFHVHNRRGLGHLMRSLNIARELVRHAPLTEIVIYARSQPPPGLCPPAMHLVVHDPDRPETAWATVRRASAPQVIVYDTMLPDDAQEIGAPWARAVYIMRKSRPDRQATILASAGLAAIDLIIIPHAADELDGPLPPAIAARSHPVGPIIRPPDPVVQRRLRGQYGIEPGALVVTSTVGGGGFQQQADAFFATIDQIHRRLCAAVPRLRHIVIQGPNYARELPGRPGMTVVSHESDLINLLAISDLVIAEGGYNTVNEVRLVKVPAVFLPSDRRYDDQEARVRALERRGLGLVLSNLPPDDVAQRVVDLCVDPDALATIRQRYAADRLITGNCRAAELILGLATA